MAGIIGIMDLIAPFMAVIVLIGAASSQLSAAVADSIGSAGLVAEVTHGRFGLKTGFAASAILAVLVTWLTDPLQVVALASRCFALYYALQCLRAIMAARRNGNNRILEPAGFACSDFSIAAALAGAPAE